MLISIVLPVCNEEKNIDELYMRLAGVMDGVADECEFIFVNDGSRDTSGHKLACLAVRDARVKVLEFSRNFGHQAAICAGMEYSHGDAVIMMDADLQHPPELVPLLLQKWREGNDIVFTIRESSADVGLVKAVTAKFFYKCINLLSSIDIPENSADFRLFDRSVVDQLLRFKERTVFLRGLVAWVGFRKVAVRYDAAPRFAGETKYTLLKMIKFAFDGITSFSTIPLHISTIIGVIVSLFSFSYAAYAIWIKLFTDRALPGWTSVLVSVLFLGGVQLLSLGIIGEYLNRIYTETKGRPQFIVKNTLGFEPRVSRS